MCEPVMMRKILTARKRGLPRSLPLSKKEGERTLRSGSLLGRNSPLLSGQPWKPPFPPPLMPKYHIDVYLVLTLLSDRSARRSALGAPLSRNATHLAAALVCAFKGASQRPLPTLVWRTEGLTPGALSRDPDADASRARPL